MAIELPQVVPKACGKSLSEAFAANNTGCPQKNALLSLKTLITLVWKQLFGQVETVLKSSDYELSFETKKSRIMLRHL